MRIAAQKNSKKIPDLSSQYCLPAVRTRLEELLSGSFSNLICPICGAEAQNGSRFNVFLSEASIVVSASILHAREKKSLDPPKKEWVTNISHVEASKVEAICCEECRYTHVPEAFSKEKKENVRAKIIKIHDQWVSMISHGKSFYVSASRIPAELCDGDEVVVYGISFGEIDDKMKLDDPSICVKPLA